LSASNISSLRNFSKLKCHILVWKAFDTTPQPTALRRAVSCKAQRTFHYCLCVDNMQSHRCPRIFRPIVLYQNSAPPPPAFPTMLYQEPSDPSQPSRAYTGEKPFPCNFDGRLQRRFAREGDLKRHKHIHTGLRPYKCKICNKAFKRKDRLKNHQHTHLRLPSQVRRPKKFLCPLCEKRFGSNRQLRCHLRTHTGEKVVKDNSLEKRT